ncbi:MAG: hypothetical protein ACR2QG_09750, partial [Gammaproteobacteria bacterium]
GNAGSVVIKGPEGLASIVQLGEEITDDAVISAEASGGGDSGIVDISAAEIIMLGSGIEVSESGGSGGTVNLRAETLDMDAGFIIADGGGTILIDAGTSDSEIISVFASALGDPPVVLDQGSVITAQGGSVTIDLPDQSEAAPQVVLSNASAIMASAVQINPDATAANVVTNDSSFITPDPRGSSSPPPSPPPTDGGGPIEEIFVNLPEEELAEVREEILDESNTDVVDEVGDEVAGDNNKPGGEINIMIADNPCIAAPGSGQSTLTAGVSTNPLRSPGGYQLSPQQGAANADIAAVYKDAEGNLIIDQVYCTNVR